MRLTGKNRGRILCDKCRHPLTSDQNGVTGLIRCDVCGTDYDGAIYKVADHFVSQSVEAVDVRDMDDAQCFFHPGKEAVAVCSVCGRMLCALCDIKQGDGDICPSCINDRKRTDIDGFSHRSWAYMQMAWLLLLASVAIPVLPACASLFFSIAGLRNRDYSYSFGRKLSLSLALLLALPSVLAYPLIIAMAVLK